MIHTYRDVAGWIFQIGMFGILLATLVYARRLEAMLQRIRRDEGGFQAALPQMDAAISAANAAAERLMADAGRADAGLRQSCDAADAMIRRLDDLLRQAAGAASVGDVAVPVADVEVKPARTAPVRPPMRSLTPRRSAKPQSRIERDLARMLSDAS